MISKKHLARIFFLITASLIVSCSQLITDQIPVTTALPSISATSQILPSPTDTISITPTNSILLADQKSVIISGFIDTQNNTGEFETIYVVESIPADKQASGDYSIRFEDSAGLEIANYSFEPLIFEGNLPFVLVLPWESQVTQIIFLKNNIELDARSASANPPVVRILSPNGGEELTDEKELVQWEASDADGDPLNFVVQYSVDGGILWHPIVVDFLDKSLELQLDFLPNTQNGMIRVLASDGFHTAQDTSDSIFAINTSSGSTLYVDIFEESDTYSGERSVILEGEAYTNSGSIPQEDVLFTWISNIDGVLAEGQELFVNAQDLTEGIHTITLTAQYEGFQTGSDSIEIEIIR